MKCPNCNLDLVINYQKCNNITPTYNDVDIFPVSIMITMKITYICESCGLTFNLLQNKNYIEEL